MFLDTETVKMPCVFFIFVMSVAPVFYVTAPKSNQNDNLKGLVQLPTNPHFIHH